MKNQVIEVLNVEHGKKVLEYWTNKGIDCTNYSGDCTKEDDDTDCYYGIIDNNFGNYNLSFVTKNNAEIITLPEEKTYPRVMYVAQVFPIPKNSYKRVVFMEKCGKYLAWLDAETIKESEKSLDVYAWSYAVDIEDVEKPEPIVEMTMEQICEALGRNVKLIK